MMHVPGPRAAEGLLTVAPLKSRGPDVMAVGILGLLTLAFFAPVLLFDQALYWGDTILGFYPAHDLWRRYVLERSLPAWNPYIFNGLPFLPDPEFSTFYPSMLLNLVLPAHRALAVDLAVHFFLTGLFTYLFLRQLRLNASPALLGGMAFAFGGFLAVRIVHVSLIRTAAWFPLLLLLLARSPFPRLGPHIVGLSAVFALQLLAGHAQTVVVGGLLVALFGFWRALSGGNDLRTWSRQIVSAAGVFASAGVVAILLAAVQVLPSFELARYSNRAGGMNFLSATSFSLPARQILMLLLPNLLGNPHQQGYYGQWVYWEMIGYAGVVTFLLALLGVTASRRSDRLLWGTVALLGVLLSMGSATPIYRIAHAVIPTLAYFRVPSRFLLWYAWAIAILAAYGAEWLLVQRQRYSRSMRVMVMCGTLVAAVALFIAFRGPGVPQLLAWLAAQTAPARPDLPTGERGEIAAEVARAALLEVRRFALLWIGPGLLAIGLSTGRLRVRLGVALLLSLVAADLFSYGARHYPTVPPAQLSKEVPTRALLELEGEQYRILTTRNYSLFWFAHMTNQDIVRTPEDLLDFRSALVPNIPVLWSIPNVAGNTPIAIDDALRFVNASVEDAARRGGQSPLLDFQAARYIFTRANLVGIYTPVYRTAKYYVWKNRNALPRGYLVTQYVVEPDDERMLQQLYTAWDPARVVFLSAPPAEDYGLRQRSDPGRITRRTYGLTRLVFDVDLNGPAIFVLSDTYYPGWTAYVDGRSQPILRANLAFRAVLLPPGAGRLEFIFEPRSAIAGGVVSGLGWLGVFSAVGILASKRRYCSAPPDRRRGEGGMH